MGNLKIEAFTLSILSAKGEFGFKCKFEDKLNIIKGNNSTGKSTLINTLIYSMGMEEIIGGKGSKTLPYAVKEYFEDERKDKVIIDNSYVMLQISNSTGETVTLRRAIFSKEKSDKLIEIIGGPHLTNGDYSYPIQPTYIHDPGSAQEDKVGFFRFLEKFIFGELPVVPNVAGGEVKLYLQTIFSSMLIEQKRGWTDYIANTPYFQIRNSRNKIIEFLFNLDVFDNDRAKSRLDAESKSINQNWEAEKYNCTFLESRHFLNIQGIPARLSLDFDIKLVHTTKISNGEKVDLADYISGRIARLEELKIKIKAGRSGSTEDELNELNLTQGEISRLSAIYESINSEIMLNKSLKSEYAKSIIDIENDLNKNKIARKLKSLGAELDLKTAIDQCPTCHQVIDDSLILADTQIQPMSVDENIAHLGKQLSMMRKYLNGVDYLIEKQSQQLAEVKNSLDKYKTLLIGLRRDISTSSTISESEIRESVKIEDEIELLIKASTEIDEIKIRLKELIAAAKNNSINRAKLPQTYYSHNDLGKLKFFQAEFKRLVKEFEYGSANIDDIEVNFDTLLPYLSGLALRGIENNKNSNTNIKTDSSASDFVRLIWAYLISILNTSRSKNGNYSGFILLDEPGQHSMSYTSMHKLLSTLSATNELQSIVAASFDQSEEIFELCLEGIDYHLIEIGNKLIKPLL